MEVDIWKKISGYENEYEVSHLGNVRSIRNNIILKPGNVGPGYPAVSLCKDGKQKTAQIHRLVMETFCPTDDKSLTVNHIDLNKENNRLDNLEWATREQQMQHASRNGRTFGVAGENNNMTKLKEREVIKMRELFKNGVSRKELSKLFNTKYEVVTAIIRGDTWKHTGVQNGSN